MIPASENLTIKKPMQKNYFIQCKTKLLEGGPKTRANRTI